MTKTIPESLQSLFWDIDFSTLSWDLHRDYLIRRILTAGSWESITWLRNQLGDAALRRWIERRQGSGLNPRQLRFWQVVLGLPRARVSEWIQTIEMSPWERRAPR